MELKTIRGYSGMYSAGSDGHIYSWHNNRWGIRDSPAKLKPFIGGNGYEYVGLRVGGTNTREPVHRLVAEAFHGAPPEGAIVCRHLDGNKRNNCPDNLCWGTHQDNADDSVALGSVARGNSKPNAVLNESIVRAARVLHNNSGVDIWTLAELYEVNTSTMRDAVTGRTWAWVD